MMNEMIIKEAVKMSSAYIKENPEAISKIAGIAVKAVKKIPKNVPYIAAGIAIGYGVKVAVNKYKEKKEAKFEEEINRRMAEMNN